MTAREEGSAVGILLAVCIVGDIVERHGVAYTAGQNKGMHHPRRHGLRQSRISCPMRHKQPRQNQDIVYSTTSKNNRLPKPRRE